MKDLKLIVNKLNYYDFIGFSCYNDIYRCINIPNSPNIHIYGSKPNTKFILDCINYMNSNIINSYNVPSYNFEHLSRKILKTFLINNIENNNMKYYQFGPEYIGTRDYDNKVITVNNFLSNNNTLLWKPEKVLLIIIDTKGIDNISKYKWFEKMNKKQILESNLWFSKLIRLSINHNKNKYYYTSSINNNRLLEKSIDVHPTNINDFKKLLLNSNKYFNNPWDIVYNSSTRNS